MKKLALTLIIVLSSCSQEPEDTSSEQWPRQDGVLGEKTQQATQQATRPNKSTSSNHVLKGYQENIQRAKDMEQEVLKAAQRQRKAADG